MFTYRINLWYTKSSPKGLGSADTAWCKWMWLSPAEHCLWVVYAEESLFDSERRVMLMEQELLPIFFTVIICAVMQVDLITTFAVVELTYKLLWLVLWFLRMICKSRQKKCPSNSAKLNGRRRKRR